MIMVKWGDCRRKVAFRWLCYGEVIRGSTALALGQAHECGLLRPCPATPMPTTVILPAEPHASVLAALPRSSWPQRGAAGSGKMVLISACFILFVAPRKLETVPDE